MVTKGEGVKKGDSEDCWVAKVEVENEILSTL